MKRELAKKEAIAVLAKYTIAMIRKDFDEINQVARREVHKAIISDAKGFKDMVSKYQAILFELHLINRDTTHMALSHISCEEV